MASKPFKGQYLGLNGFVWWVGIVEDVNDPIKSGRVRVRCFEWHTSDKGELPTEDLPWSQIVMPVNSTSNSGLGNSPTGLVTGSWVMGFFLDGEDAQKPMVTGTIPGIPSNSPNPNIGFNDPSGTYPNLVDEPDTNRLARNDQSYPHAVLAKKQEDLEQNGYNIKKSSGGTYAVPGNHYATNYPDNQVFETKSGHIKEYDDTEGQERIHEYHKSGTNYEITKDGDKIERVIRDRYIVVSKDDQVYIKGDAFFTVDGNCDTYIGGNWNITVGGTKTEKVTKAVSETYSSTQTTEVTNKLKITAKKIDLNPDLIPLIPGLSKLGGMFGSIVGFEAIASTLGSVGEIAQSGLGGIGDLGGGFLSSVTSGVTGSLGNLATSAAGSLGGLSSLASGVTGGLGSLAGTASFMSAGGLTGALGAVTGGLNLPNVVGSLGGDLIPGITSELTGALPSSLTSFVGEGGGFLPDSIANVTNFAGDLGVDTVFSGVGDFTSNLTSNLSINKVLGESGASLLGDNVGNLLDVSSTLNGFSSDVFSGATLAGATTDILKQGTNIFGSDSITSKITSTLPAVFNTQKLLKSATDVNFGSLDFPGKIQSAFNIDSAVDSFISSTPLAQKVRSASGLTDFAFKQDLVSNAVGQIGDKLLDSSNAGRIVNVASDASTQMTNYKAIASAASTGVDSLGNSSFLSGFDSTTFNADEEFLEI